MQQRETIESVNASDTVEFRLYCGSCIPGSAPIIQGMTVDICLWLDPEESPGVCLMDILSMTLLDGTNSFALFPDATGVEVFDNLAGFVNCDDLNWITPESTDLYPTSKKSWLRRATLITFS
jgi:hypothetical protein